MQRRSLSWLFSMVAFVALSSSACGTGIVGDVNAVDESSSVESALAVGTVTSPVYADAMATGWADWSWATRDVSNTSPVATGTKSIAAKFAPWTGLYFQNKGFGTAGFTHLVLMVNGGTAYDAASFGVQVESGGSYGPVVALGASCDGGKIRANTWVSCRLPLASLGAASKSVTGIIVQETSGRTFTSNMYFDVIGFGPGTVTQPPTVDAGVGGGTGSGGGMVEPGSPGPADVIFTVRTDTSRRSISPLIYGINDDSRIATVKQGLVRAGGNRWTAYNWENNASNAGSDYCYQNDAQLGGGATPGEAVRQRIAAASAAGATTLITIPIVDYVAADKNGNCDVRNSGANYLLTRFRQNKSTKGSALSTSPDTSDGVVYQDEFVNYIKGAAGSAPVIFSLDNEPDLWSDTHPEVHPTPVTYSELISRNLDYAKAIKRVWPTAKVTGFVSYGWVGYVNLQNASDAASHGDFTDYYLAQMKAAEATSGTRLIDYLDLHWYPEAKGDGVRIIGTATSAGAVEARVQAPRSLWDDTYTETSWVSSSVGGPIKLLPLMNAKINAGYPGTKLAITEWNYGGGGHISGAMATADALGAYGREGVGLATMWRLNSDESFTEAGFMAYRNFDGAGSQFGDTSVSAVNSDRAAASVYASTDASNPGRVVIVAINKRTTAKTAGLAVAASSRFTTAQVYTVTSAGAVPVAGSTIAAVATNAFKYTMPAQSVSIIVLKP